MPPKPGRRPPGGKAVRQAIDPKSLQNVIKAMEERIANAISRAASQSAERAKELVDQRVKEASFVDSLVEQISGPAVERTANTVEERLKGDLGRQLLAHLGEKLEDQARERTQGLLRSNAPELRDALLAPVEEMVGKWLSEQQAELLAKIEQEATRHLEATVSKWLESVELPSAPPGDAPAGPAGGVSLAQVEESVRQAVEKLESRLRELGPAPAAPGDAAAGVSLVQVQDTVQQAVEKVEARLEELASEARAAPAAPAEPVDLTELVDRASQEALKALEERQAPLVERIDEVRAKVEAPLLSARALEEALKLLEKRIVGLEQERPLEKGGSSADLGPIEARLTALEDQVTSLSSLSERTAAPPLPDDALRDQIAALWQANLEERSAWLEGMIEAIEPRLAELESRELRPAAPESAEAVGDRLIELERRVENLKQNLELNALAERVAVLAVGPVMEAIDGRINELDLETLPERVVEQVVPKATGRIMKSLKGKITDEVPRPTPAKPPAGEASDATQSDVGFLDDDFAKFRKERLAKKRGQSGDHEAADPKVAETEPELEPTKPDEWVGGGYGDEDLEYEPEPDTTGESESEPEPESESEPEPEPEPDPLSPEEAEANEAIQALRKIHREEGP